MVASVNLLNRRAARPGSCRERAGALCASLRGVYYNAKSNGKAEVGVIAEEVAQVLPQVVGIGNDGQAEGVDYSRLTALLIEATKEQQAQIRKPKDQAIHELYMNAWSPSTGEARWGIYPITSCASMWPNGSNYSFYCDKELDQMIDKAVASTTLKDRDAFLKKAQEVLVQDPEAIYLLATKETVGMSLKVNGIINSPLELVYADKDTWKAK